jgi:hypothetical protein
VELVKEYVNKNFPSHSLLDYALAVEKVTTAKKDTVSFDFFFHAYSLTNDYYQCSLSSTLTDVLLSALSIFSAIAGRSQPRKLTNISRLVL